MKLGSCFVPGYPTVQAPTEHCETIVKMGGDAVLGKQLLDEVHWFVTNGRCIDMVENPFTHKCCEWHHRYEGFRERAKQLGINL